MITKMIGFHISKELFAKFKLYCSKIGMPMSRVVTELIKREMKEKALKKKEK